MLPFFYILSFNISLNVIKQRISFRSVRVRQLYYTYIHSYIVVFHVYYNASVNSNCPQLPPPPGLLRGICPPCQSRGGAFANFAVPGGKASPTPGPLASFDTHAVSYQNITTEKVLLQKKQIGSPVKDRNKLKRNLRACSRFYAYIFSLLFKPELHSRNRSYRCESTCLVIESNFCWYYFKNILSYLYNYSYNFISILKP